MTDISGSHAPYALVVDDHEMVRSSAMEILEDAGFRTFEATDGDAAIALLLENHASIKLLFTDVEMPGSRGGFAVARETAQLYPHIAIVVASGVTRPRPDDMPPGAVFIPKPFSADMVLAHLQRILPNGQRPEPLQG